MDFPSSVFDGALTAIGAAVDAVHEHDYKAHQDQLRKSLECVEDHAKADGKAQAQSDFAAKQIDISQPPQISDMQMNHVVDLCKVPQYIDHLPPPPTPGNAAEAAAMIVLWPSDLHEPNEGGQMAQTHYVNAFGSAYDARVSEFDLRQQHPSNPCTPSGHYAPELWVETSSLQAALPCDLHQQGPYPGDRVDTQHGPSHDAGSGTATTGSGSSGHSGAGSSSGSSSASSGSSAGAGDSGSSTSSSGSSGTSSASSSSGGI